VQTRTLLRAGIVGTVVTAVCCATPVLAILFGVVGLSAWAGGLDYVLFPALAMFIGLTLYALKRRRDEPACCALPGEPVRNASGGRP
jgi:mercuric ion transport protein